MTLLVLILLLVFPCSFCTHKAKTDNVTTRKWQSNLNCAKIDCPTTEEPICVKMKHKNEPNKYIYVVLINKCEMEYMKCHEGLETKIVSEKKCGHKSNDRKYKFVKTVRHKRSIGNLPTSHKTIKTLYPTDENKKEVMKTHEASKTNNQHVTTKSTNATEALNQASKVTQHKLSHRKFGNIHTSSESRPSELLNPHFPIVKLTPNLKPLLISEDISDTSHPDTGKRSKIIDEGLLTHEILDPNMFKQHFADKKDSKIVVDSDIANTNEEALSDNVKETDTTNQLSAEEDRPDAGNENQSINEPRDHSPRENPDKPDEENENEFINEPSDHNSQENPDKPDEENENESIHEPSDHSPQENPDQPDEENENESINEPSDHSPQKNPDKPNEENENEFINEPSDHSPQENSDKPDEEKESINSQNEYITQENPNESEHENNKDVHSREDSVKEISSEKMVDEEKDSKVNNNSDDAQISNTEDEEIFDEKNKKTSPTSAEKSAENIDESTLDNNKGVTQESYVMISSSDENTVDHDKKKQEPFDIDKNFSSNVDTEQYQKDCPTVCPSRDVMLCARCKDGVYRTFMSLCHLRVFNCRHPEEKLELVSRKPCILSAPFLYDMPAPKGRVVEMKDDDRIHRYIYCKNKGKLSGDDPRCNFDDSQE